MNLFAESLPRTVPAHANPFRSACVERLAFRWDTGETLVTLRQRLDAVGRRAVVVGAKGSGKTTLLELLARDVVDTGQSLVWLRLRRDPAQTRARVRQFLATPVQDTWICLDGLEQLGPLTWARVRWHARNAQGLIATSHRSGRLPVLRRHDTTSALLQDLVHELTGTMRTDTTAVWQQQRGDLRNCLAHYYRLSAGLSGLTPVSGAPARPISAAH